MSKSVRLSDSLFEDAKQTGVALHRSPPQQIEHWAQIGRVLESALSYPAQKNAGTWGSKADIDSLITEVTSSQGKQKAKEVIHKNSIPLKGKTARSKPTNQG